MSLRKSGDFIADAEIQFEWYLAKAGQIVANRYLDSLQAACNLLAQYPQLGPEVGFTHDRLRHWRFFLVFRPFNKHIIFYEVSDQDVVMRRVMHGYRHLQKRLLQPPGTA